MTASSLAELKKQIDELRLELAMSQDKGAALAELTKTVASLSGASSSSGTWTPVLTFATPGNLSVAYAAQVGTYTKVGSLVYLTMVLQTSSFTFTTASGNLLITGAPFTSKNVSSASNHGAIAWGGITKVNYTQVAWRLTANTTISDFLISGSGQGLATVTAADMPTGGTVVLVGSLVYQV